MNTPRYPPTPTSIPPAPGEGSHPSPVVSPGVLPKYMLSALRRWADCLDCEAIGWGTIADVFEEAQPNLTDALADAMVEAFGVPFPESTPEAKAWARKRGLLPIPDEPMSGDAGIVNLAGIKVERDRLEGLAAAQRILIGMEAFLCQLPGPVEMRNGDVRQVLSASFDGMEIVLFPSGSSTFPIRQSDLGALYQSTRDAGKDLAAQYAAALAALEAKKC